MEWFWVVTRDTGVVWIIWFNKEIVRFEFQTPKKYEAGILVVLTSLKEKLRTMASY